MIAHARAPRANSRTSRVRSGERRAPPQYGHLRGTFWTLVDQGAISLGTFLLNIQLARHLGAPEYGTFALLLGGCFIVQHINGSLIYYPLMLRLAAGRQERSSDLVSTSVAMTAASSLVCSAAVAACLVAFGRRDIAAAAALYLVLWQFQDLSRRILLAEFRHRAAAAIDGITYIGAAGAIAVLATYDCLTLSTALTAMAGTCALALAVQTLRHRPTSPTVKDLSEFLRESWLLGQWAFLNGVVSIGSWQIFPWALAIFDGPAAAAGFQAVMNVANLANPIVFGLCNIILPAVAQSHQKSGVHEAWGTAQTFIVVGAALLLLYAIPLMLLPRTVLVLFYGENSPYTGLYHAVSIVVFAAAINAIVDMLSAFIHGVKAPRLAARMNLIGFATAALLLPLIGAVTVVSCAVVLAAARIVRAVAAWRLLHALRLGAGEADDCHHGPARLDGGPYFRECIESARFREIGVASSVSVARKGRPRVCVVAYACEPGVGSEPGAGWGLVSTIGEFASCTVLVGPEHVPVLERWLAEHAGAPLRFVEVPEPSWARLAKWHRVPRFLVYLVWIRRARGAAKTLHARTPFDAAWHATFAAYWLPSPVAGLGVPMVLGPVGGAVNAPLRFWGELGLSGIAGELLDLISVRLLASLPATRRTWRRAQLLLANTEETIRQLPEAVRGKARLFNHCLFAELPALHANPRPGVIVFPSSLERRNGPSLPIRALRHTPETVRLLFLNDGPERRRLQRLADRIGVSHRVEFRGRIPREEMFEILCASSGAVFAGIREACGMGITETLSFGCPAILLDHGVAHTLARLSIDARRIALVPAARPARTIRALGEAMARFAADPPAARGPNLDRDAPRDELRAAFEALLPPEVRAGGSRLNEF